MKNLQHRLDRIEELKKPAMDNRVNIRYADLHMLPHTYVGEKHRVLVKGYPYTLEEPGECVIQEYPGPGPELKFDFDKDGRRTILVEYVESDGDGHNNAVAISPQAAANDSHTPRNRCRIGRGCGKAMEVIEFILTRG